MGYLNGEWRGMTFAPCEVSVVHAMRAFKFGLCTDEVCIAPRYVPGMSPLGRDASGGEEILALSTCFLHPANTGSC